MSLGEVRLLLDSTWKQKIILDVNISMNEQEDNITIVKKGTSALRKGVRTSNLRKGVWSMRQKIETWRLWKGWSYPYQRHFYDRKKMTNARRHRNKLEYGSNKWNYSEKKIWHTLMFMKNQDRSHNREEENLAWTIWKIVEESYHTRNAVT
jgi:hypothetical protein